MFDGIKYYYKRFGVDGVKHAVKAKLANTNELIKVVRPDIKFPFYLRLRTSDVPTFDQVFTRKDYEFDVQNSPYVIVDAGANIGLASIYFANRFPDSKIIAIEPESSNYKLLEINVSPYENIIPLNMALWNKNEQIDLVDPGLGKWGFMTQAESDQTSASAKKCHTVMGITVNEIMTRNGLEKIDILKMDIEGAEREVFMSSPSWVGKVDALIVELHERLKPGCMRSFYNGTNGFDAEWVHGENVFLARKNCVLKHPH